MIKKTGKQSISGVSVWYAPPPNHPSFFLLSNTTKQFLIILGGQQIPLWSVVICKRSHATQPPVLSTVSIGTFVATLLAEADLVECGVKIVISLAVSCSTDFIRLARVSLEAGLYGLDVVINKLCYPCVIWLHLVDLVLFK